MKQGLNQIVPNVVVGVLLALDFWLCSLSQLKRA